METWIKLYRKFDEWEWFNISEMVHLFIYLLLNANNSDSEWHGIEIKRGQLITGRKTLNLKTGISEQTLRTCLRRLKSTKEITIKSTNKYSIITICKYNNYQPKEKITNQQLTSNQPATNQQLTTVKELKEDKNIKKKSKKFNPPLLSEVKSYFFENEYSEQAAIKMFNSYSVANWIDSYGKPVLNWKQKAINVWFRPENKINGKDQPVISITTINENTR